MISLGCSVNKNIQKTNYGIAMPLMAKLINISVMLFIIIYKMGKYM